MAAHAHQRANLFDYLCGAWNACHAGEERLKGLQITYVRERMLPDYRPLAREVVPVVVAGLPPGTARPKTAARPER